MLQIKMISQKRSLFFLLLLTATVHISGLSGQFFGDDLAFIVKNSSIMGDIQAIPGFFKSGVWDHSSFGIKDTIMYRPISLCITSILYNIAGTDPFLWHLFGFFMHCVNTILVTILTKYVYPETSHEDRVLGAAFFAVHPALASAVAWVSGHSDVILTTMFMAAFLSYLRFKKHEKPIDLVLTIIFFLMALLTKETVVIFPFLILVYDLTDRTSKDKLSFRIYCLFIVLLILFLFIRSIVLDGTIIGGNEMIFSGNNFGRLMDYFIFSMKSFLIPWPLPYFSRHIPGGISNWADTTIGISLILIAFFAALKYQKIRFPVIWILVSLMPPLLLSFVNRGIFALRFLYLPCVGVAVIMSLFSTYVKTFFKKSYLVFTAIILCFSFLTIKEIPNWKNSEAWAKKIIRFDPGYISGWSVLGEYYEQAEDPVKEIETYRQALKKVTETDARVVISERLGQLYSLLDRNEESLQLFSWISRQEGYEHRGYLGIGNIYYIYGKHELARDAYEKAVKFSPKNFNSLFNLGLLYEKDGQSADALRLYIKALEVVDRDTSKNAVAHAKNFLNASGN